MKPEMLVPDFSSRIEESHEGPGRRIKGGEVRSLVEVATVARQCKVAGVVRSGMLPRNHVLNVKSRINRPLWQMAILTLFPRAESDEASGGGVH